MEWEMGIEFVILILVRLCFIIELFLYFLFKKMIVIVFKFNNKS